MRTFDINLDVPYRLQIAEVNPSLRYLTYKDADIPMNCFWSADDTKKAAEKLHNSFPTAYIRVSKTTKGALGNPSRHQLYPR
jgi:hypothetical protein